MANHIFVRTLTVQEAEQLEHYSKHGLDYQKKRANVIKYSSEGYTTTEIVQMVNMHSNNVRKWINRFNAEGLAIIKHHNKGKSPRQKFTKENGDTIAAIALSKPRECGMKFTTWSLPKLKQYLIERKIIASISIETLRTMLLSRGISFQKTKTWLHSTDPDYQKKKEDVLSLYNNPPKDGVVLCFDEKGSITVKEYQGSGWTKEQIKARLHYKIKGLTEMFATYNPNTQEAVIMFDDKKNCGSD